MCSDYSIIKKNIFYDSTSFSVTHFFPASLQRKKKSQKGYLSLSPLMIFCSHFNLLWIKLWSLSIDLFFVKFIIDVPNKGVISISFSFNLLAILIQLTFPVSWNFSWLPDSTHSWFSFFLAFFTLFDPLLFLNLEFPVALIWTSLSSHSITSSWVILFTCIG